MSLVHPLEVSLNEALDKLLARESSIDSIRKSAWVAFVQRGLPKPKDEAFQYLKLASLSNKSLEQQASRVDETRIEKTLAPFKGKNVLVTINGQFAPRYSSFEDLEDELVILPLSEAYSTYNTFIQDFFESWIKKEEDPFALLSIALHQEGVFVYVPKKSQIEEELILLEISDSTAHCAPLSLISMGAQSSLKVRTLASRSGSDALTTGFYGFHLDQGAILKHTHGALNASGLTFDATRVNQQKGSHYQKVQMVVEPTKSRLSHRVELLGEEAESEIFSLAALKKAQESHVHILIEHKAPNCLSRQLVKNLLDGESTSSFEGKIKVDDIAQQTNAYQLNANCILSDDASAYSKPNLEIFADDVKASHGSTTGQVDTDQLFYLRSRGLSEEQSKKILLRGFCDEVCDVIAQSQTKSLFLQKIRGLLRFTMTTRDLKSLRADFPMLNQKMNGRPLVYLDNGATTFKPKCVSEAISRYYENETSTVHRGIYALAETATSKLHAIRSQVANFIGASSDKEIIFTSGTTASINLVALSWGEVNIEEGDEILISEIEHHSNFVPWQFLCDRKQAHLKLAPVKESGELDLEAFKDLLGPKTKLVSLPHISNAFGVENPIKEIVTIVREHSSAKILVDGAQSTPHLKIDVKALDLDFFAFSAHKMYGPTGIGVLYGKEEILNEMPPLFGGGDMIDQVSLEKTTFNTLPHKFEAGTPNIAGILGFGAALDYLEEVGLDVIAAHEKELVQYATEKLRAIEGIHIYSDIEQKGALISFSVKGAHPLDLGTLLNLKGIALRTGHLCAQPGLKRFNQTSICRISFGLYNAKEEIDFFIESLQSILSQLLT